MRVAMDRIETCQKLSCPSGDYRLRVVVAEASLHYMETVSDLLELHEIVDLLGRAANFEETIQLVVSHQPDLVLLDLDMLSAIDRESDPREPATINRLPSAWVVKFLELRPAVRKRREAQLLAPFL